MEWMFGTVVFAFKKPEPKPNDNSDSPVPMQDIKESEWKGKGGNDGKPGGKK